MIPLLLWSSLLAADDVAVPVADPVADHYDAGLNLARAGRFEQARMELLRGRAEFPSDKRYAIELAGVEYRLGNLAAARADLRDALRLDSGDPYANEFLGTLYFLNGNIDAALKYWNRVHKPRIASIEISPEPRLSPTLVDRAIAFPPGETLRRDQYDSTLAWLRATDALGNFRTELEARESGDFAAVIHWPGAPKTWMWAASTLASVPFQTARFDFRNIGGEAITVSALARWDAQKRRLAASISGPLAEDPRRRYNFFADARSETWNLGQAPDFRLQKIDAGASLRFIPSGRFSWETGFGAASRSYAGAPQFDPGFDFRYFASAELVLLNDPEQRLTVTSNGTAELGRFLGQGAAPQNGLYGRVQTGVVARWFPRSSGSDYETTVRLRFGGAAGNTPFDDLFMLGVERDNDLPLRAYAGTLDGKKGSSPIGGRYFLVNIDHFKEIWKPGPATLDAGPLFDAGRMWNPAPGSFSGGLLIDAGVQLRLRLMPGTSVVVSYGHSLNSGRRALYALSQ